jgi:hypothetical protein
MPCQLSGTRLVIQPDEHGMGGATARRSLRMASTSRRPTAVKYFSWNFLRSLYSKLGPFTVR